VTSTRNPRGEKSRKGGTAPPDGLKELELGEWGQHSPVVCKSFKIKGLREKEFVKA